MMSQEVLASLNGNKEHSIEHCIKIIANFVLVSGFTARFCLTIIESEIAEIKNSKNPTKGIIHVVYSDDELKNYSHI